MRFKYFCNVDKKVYEIKTKKGVNLLRGQTFLKIKYRPTGSKMFKSFTLFPSNSNDDLLRILNMKGNKGIKKSITDELDREIVIKNGLKEESLLQKEIEEKYKFKYRASYNKQVYDVKCKIEFVKDFNYFNFVVLFKLEKDLWIKANKINLLNSFNKDILMNKIVEDKFLMDKIYDSIEAEIIMNVNKESKRKKWL